MKANYSEFLCRRAFNFNVEGGIGNEFCNEVVFIPYGQVLSDQVISMYVEDLSDLPTEKCIAAYSIYRRNSNNRSFPLPAQIREIVDPGQSISIEEEARETGTIFVRAVTMAISCFSKLKSGSSSRLRKIKTREIWPSRG